MASKEKPESLELTPKSEVKAEENLELTPASEIKKLREERDAGRNVRLPSGTVVCVKKPNISVLISEGEIPNELLSIALGKESMAEMTPEGIQKGLKMMNLLVRHSVVSPKVVEENPQDNEILISDLSEEDKGFIVGDAQGEVGKLKSFRESGSKQDSSRPSVQKVSKPKTE